MTDTKTTTFGPFKNTDRELWREREGDYYSPSIHVTEHGGIGMEVGGYVIVMPIGRWHALAKTSQELARAINEWSAAHGEI